MIIRCLHLPPPAAVAIENPFIIALVVLVFAAVPMVAGIHLRYASGWQLLSEFFCDPMDREGADDASVTMSRSAVFSCGMPCWVKLDANHGCLCLQGPRIAGGYFKPLRIPLSRFLPARSVMWTQGFRVETGDPQASILFLFDEAFTKRLASAIETARG